MLDFTKKETQIDLNSQRLKEEYDRYFEIKSRIGIISIIYSIFAVFSVQLIQFLITYNNPGILYKIFLSLYLTSFTISVIFSILLLIPKAIAYKNTPKHFYEYLFNEYKNSSKIPNGSEQYYIRESYNLELEEVIKRNFKLNNKKSRFHYWAFTLALFALIPYFICVGIKITKIPNNIQDVKLTNECFNSNNSTISKNNTKEEKAMFQEKEETNQSDQSQKPTEEPKVDPDLVIRTEPVMIKEHKETPEKPKLDSTKTVNKPIKKEK